ncbi:MAG: RNA polymerase sigma factor [Turicibacter sp.]|nr:RNA polymerase sigma factor [Turicibacter sp.]
MDFEKIYADYFLVVYKYILSLCRNEKIAEDVTQETFFKALKNVDKFKGECKLEVWLCQIAKNHYFTQQKIKNL